MNRNLANRARLFSLSILCILLATFFLWIGHAEARGLGLDEIFYVLKTPDQLSRFMLENFTWDLERDDSPAYDPDTFLQIRSGVCRDFAVFAGAWLNLHGYFPEQVIIAYWTIHGQAAHALCVTLLGKISGVSVIVSFPMAKISVTIKDITIIKSLKSSKCA